MKIACHVDDLLLISSSRKVCDGFLRYLRGVVHEVKEFHDNIIYLGVTIKRDRALRKIYLSQPMYVDAIINQLLLPNEKGSKFPIKSGSGFGEDGMKRNRAINDQIGKLRFLADRTRPDLLYHLSILSRFMANPNDEVLLELNRFIRYIKFTRDKVLTVGSTQPINLFGMSDASYVQIGDCRSQLGYMIFLSSDSAPVYCRSKRADTVSLSSTQAEVDALVELVKEIIWCQGFLDSVGIEVSAPTDLFTDNQPTVTLAADGNHLRRSKHYVVKTTFIKEQVELGVVNVKHVPGLENHPDILTKPLCGRLLDYHTTATLGLPLPS